MREHLRHAGINIGYGHVKLKTDSGYVQYGSVVGKTRPTIDMIGRPAKTQNVEVNGQSFEVGEEAALSGSYSQSKQVFSKWAEHQHYQVLKQSVLDRLSAEGISPWSVVVGLPVAQHKDEEYRQLVLDLWKGQQKGKFGSIDIRHVKVVPEPIGAYWAHGMEVDRQGQRNAERLRKLNVTVFDFGYFTTDWNTINRSQIDHDKSDSVNWGVYRLLLRMRELIGQRYNKHVNLVEVEMAMLDRWIISIRGKSIDMKALTAEVVSEMGPDLMDTLRTAMDNSVGEILLVGGGASLFMPLIEKTFSESEVTILRGAQGANAVGYWYMAQAVSGVV